jgi:hypothetical protein
LISIRPNTSSTTKTYSSRPDTAETINSNTAGSLTSHESVGESNNDIQYFNDDNIVNGHENNNADVMSDFRRNVISEKRMIKNNNNQPLPLIKPSCKAKKETFQLFHIVKK